MRTRSWTPTVLVCGAVVCAAWCLGAGTLSAQTTSPKELLGKLAQGDAAVKAAALDEATALGNRGAFAVKAISELLRDADEEVRWRAGRALGAVGPQAEPAIDALRAAMKDKSGKVRAYAAYALGEIGAPSKAAAEELVSGALDKDVVVRRSAVRALLKIKAPRELTIPLWLKALESSDPRDVMPAVATLAEQGEAVVPAMIEALEHPQACYWASVVLTELGPKAKDAVKPLEKMLSHGEPECRLQAIMAYAAIGESAHPAVNSILGQLQEERFGGLKHAALYALGKIKPQDPAMVKAVNTALEKTVQSDDPLARVLAAWAAIELAPTNLDVIKAKFPFLIEGLKSDDVSLRLTAARAMAETSAPQAMTAPLAAAAISQLPAESMGLAIDAFASLGKVAVPRLAGALKNEKLRKPALAALRKMEAEAEGAVPALVDLLKSSDDETKAEVQFTLAAVGAPAKVALPLLAKSLSSENDQVRYSACYALGQIGPAAKDASGELQKYFTCDDEFMRLASVWAMLRIHPEDARLGKQAVPLLTRALKAERENVRAEAAASLGKLGKLAAPALDALKQLQQDPSATVREAAADAVAKIEAASK